MNPLVAFVAVTLIAAAGAVGGWRAAMDHRDALELAEVKGKVDALTATAEAIAKVKIVQQTITKQAETVVREHTVYRDCKLEPTAKALLNAAAKGEAP